VAGNSRRRSEARSSLEYVAGGASRRPHKPNTNRRSPTKAVLAAAPSKCPNKKGAYIWSLPADLAYELPCKSWACSWCGWKKREAAKIALGVGLEAAWDRGERVRFLTLTDGSRGSGEMMAEDIYAAWNRLRAVLKKSGELEQYAAVLEAQKRGALHLHILATGKFIAQRRLSRLAKQSGFGAVADIREVKAGAEETMPTGEANPAAALYVVKEMGGYLTKEKAAHLVLKTNRRRRPLRLSREWGISLRQAEEAWSLYNRKTRDNHDQEHDQEQEDLAPWAYVLRTPSGLRVRLPDGSTVDSVELAA
jgi:hypothetical protein